MSYRVKKWDRPGRKPDAGELTQQMISEGYAVFRWSDRPGAVYSEHEHAEEQSHCIISGVLEVNVRGFGTVVLKAGDRDFMPAGTVHSARVLGGKPVVYLIGSK